MDLFQSLLSYGPRTERLRIHLAFPHDSTPMVAFLWDPDKTYHTATQASFRASFRRTTWQQS